MEKIELRKLELRIQYLSIVLSEVLELIKNLKNEGEK